ncbi:MAG: hypothetical protein QOJ38_862 [Solirubrobacterales bacterium]|nr:hypothetical protein [Solirubrobacterales bacterium]
MLDLSDKLISLFPWTITGRSGALSKVENQSEGIVDVAYLIDRQMPNPVAKAASVYGADHLAHDPR